VVASKKKSTNISDLSKTFTNMHKVQLKLNPEKNVLGVHRGKVLGCLVSAKGIEANPDKIKAIIHMKPPQSRKDVQKLTRRIAALNRFIAKLAEQSRAFPSSQYREAPLLLNGDLSNNMPSMTSQCTSSN
jgi:hypothetical protein